MRLVFRTVPCPTSPAIPGTHAPTLPSLTEWTNVLQNVSCFQTKRAGEQLWLRLVHACSGGAHPRATSYGVPAPVSRHSPCPPVQEPGQARGPQHWLHPQAWSPSARTPGEGGRSGDLNPAGGDTQDGLFCRMHSPSYHWFGIFSKAKNF